MKQGLATAERLIGKAAMACAVVALLVILVIGSVDVFAQLASRPLPFKLELSETLFAVSIFLGWPAVQSRRQHITVDVFSKNYSIIQQRIVTVISDLLGLAVFGLISFTIWRLALKSVAMGETSLGYLSFPVYPFKLFCAVGVTLSVVVILIQLTSLGKTSSDNEGGLNVGN